MSRIAQKFRKTELTRAIRAAEEASPRFSRVEIAKDGTIAIIMGQQADTELPSPSNNSFDRIIEGK